MVSTLNALLSRNIPTVLAHNLVLAEMTLGKLVTMNEVDLNKLGLEDFHIQAIRDNRPSIPEETLRQVLEDSWRVCCVCTKRERDVVIHHIKEWSQGGTHDESNLAVLCLDDHHRTHLRGGLAKGGLTANEIRNAKEKWICRAKKLRDAYHSALLVPHQRSARWLWIHLDRLRALSQHQPLVRTDPIDEHTRFLLDNGFIDEAGHITAETQWNEALAKSSKDYAFDSSNCQRMAIYVSDVLGRLLHSLQVMDITDMLQDKELLKSYIKEGMFVFFRSQIDIQKNPEGFPKDDQWLQATVSMTDVRLVLCMNLWTSLSMTAKGTHLLREAERSVLAEVVSITTVGTKTRVDLTPLGISSDFLLRDPSQGAWVRGANNTDFKKRRKRAKVD